ncbi:hypothetical protein FRC03_003523 [Tulasnella sp. 419]|nr:hypothetical protein FRC03_003523 [Tulasnella sp. 419]
MSTTTRRQALLSWEAALTDLFQAASVYMDRSSRLCQHLFNHGGNAPGDISLGDALERVENRRGDTQNVAKDIYDVTSNFLGCRNMWDALVPFNKLPPEVLSQIVLFGLEKEEEEKDRYELFMDSEIAYDTASEHDVPDDWPLNKNDPEHDIISYKKPIPFPIVFSHVSRRWRDVALSTARAWTFVDFSKPDAWTRECLARSKRSPLTVFIDVYSKKIPSADERVAEIKEILLPHISRIVSLEVKSRYGYHQPVILSSIFEEKKLFRPRRLKLQSEERNTPIDIIYWLDFKLYAMVRQVPEECIDSVRELDLTRVHFQWDHPIYHNLTSLRLASIITWQHMLTKKQLFAVFAASPNLESLALESVELDSPDSDPKDPSTLKTVTLARLHTLTLAIKPMPTSMIETSNYGHFPLQVLTTPNLVRLKLVRVTEMKSLVGFVRRNIQVNGRTRRKASTVQYLQLLDCWLTEKTLNTILADMPNIVDLGIKSGAGFTDKVLQSFKTTPKKTSRSKPTLPQLHTLRLVTCYITSVDTLQDLVRRGKLGTQQGVSALKKLVIIDCGISPTPLQWSWFFEEVEKFVLKVEETGSEDETSDDSD